VCVRVCACVCVCVCVATAAIDVSNLMRRGDVAAVSGVAGTAFCLEQCVSTAMVTALSTTTSTSFTYT
jgi:hypothetical protein